MLVELDSLDQRLIAELSRNARVPLSELAARLGVARATVRNRMDRLVESGEIAGFTILTRADVMPAPVRALMMIRIEGRGSARIVARLAGLPQVTEVHSTNGRWDLIVAMSTETLTALDKVIHQIRDLEGITASETNLLLATRGAGKT